MTEKTSEGPWPEVVYALSKGMGRSADIEREGFGWRIVPPGDSFWQRWRADKDAMKRQGHRVRKSETGDWLVAREMAA
jgi:hypothetical protein